jgi:hypothetical protein
MRRIAAADLFDDEQLTLLEQCVTYMPEQRKLFSSGEESEAREFPRYIDLPPALERIARDALPGARSIQYDVVTNEIIY